MRRSVIRVILLCYSQEDESEVIDELDKLLDDLEPSIVQELPTVPTDKVEEDHNIEDQLPDVPTTVKKLKTSPFSMNNQIFSGAERKSKDQDTRCSCSQLNVIRIFLF